LSCYVFLFNTTGQVPCRWKKRVEKINNNLSSNQMMNQHWPEVQFYFSLEPGAPSTRCDTEAPAEEDHHRDRTTGNTEQGERFDILSALPEEVAIYLLSANALPHQTEPTWSAWELRHVVGLVCRNWRRLALDASVLSTTLHQYIRTSSGQDCVTLIPS
jgi:hypothetical protein